MELIIHSLLLPENQLKIIMGFQAISHKFILTLQLEKVQHCQLNIIEEVDSLYLTTLFPTI